MIIEMSTAGTSGRSEFTEKEMKEHPRVMAIFYMVIWVRLHGCIHLLKFINYT